jgi:tetratricopeptide (TPR) repeat protein
MYKNEPAFPKDLRFGEEFETTLARWNDSWRKTNVEFVRRISITPETDFEAIERQLKRAFAGAEVYPDLGLNAFNTGANGLNFFNTVQQLILKGNVQKAVRAGQLAVELYPQSDLSNAALAIGKIAGGEKDSAQMLLKKSSAIDARGAASADNLNFAAYDFASAGKPEIGLELLKAAAQLYPKEANLYDSLGEFYLRKGERKEALKFYKKVLELNPNSTNAKRMLKELNAQP